MELEQLIVRIEADSKPLQSALGTLSREADRSLGSMAKLGDRIGTSFASAAVHGQNLGQILRGLLQDIANSTLRETVINPLGGLIGGALGSLFGRASGGSVSAGTPYLVGERGPEVFVPGSAGRIDSQPAASASGVTVSFAIDARGADAGAAEKLRQAAAEIESRTFAAVFAAMERGGRYARISGRRS